MCFGCLRLRGFLTGFFSGVLRHHLMGFESVCLDVVGLGESEKRKTYLSTGCSVQKSCMVFSTPGIERACGITIAGSCRITRPGISGCLRFSSAPMPPPMSTKTGISTVEPCVYAVRPIMWRKFLLLSYTAVIERPKSAASCGWTLVCSSIHANAERSVLKAFWKGVSSMCSGLA